MTSYWVAAAGGCSDGNDYTTTSQQTIRIARLLDPARRSCDERRVKVNKAGDHPCRTGFVSAIKLAAVVSVPSANMHASSVT